MNTPRLAEDRADSKIATVRVYQYGLLRPSENGLGVATQMMAAHRYRNRLVELERKRRAAQREVICQAVPPEIELDYIDLNTTTESAAQAIRDARKESRNRSETAAMRERLAELRQKRKVALGALFEARRQLRENPEILARREAIDEADAEERRKARAACGTYWGTYLLVEAEADASRKMPLFDGAVANDPRFVRWRGEAQVSVQIQGGMPADQAFGQDNRIRIERLPDRPGMTPGSRRSGQRAMLWLRIGSNLDRSPIWAKWPMVMHRPFPNGAVIKRATVSRRIEGPRDRWTVEFTIAHPAPIERTDGGGVVGVDLGWRVREDGSLRVAAWHGDDDREGELLLSAETLAGLTFPSGLRATRDTHFDAVRETLSRWMHEHTEIVPAWLRERTRSIGQWRDIERLSNLVSHWGSVRFADDRDIFPVLDMWRKRNRHLYQYEAGQRAGSQRNRREIYRRFAADLAEKYSALAIEDFDRRKIARLPREEDKAENETARGNRVLAASSVLEQCLRQAFLARGRKVIELSAVNTTRICHACAAVNRWDQAEELRRTCSECGIRWDQDENAARNLCANGIERLRDVRSAGTAREGEPGNNDNGLRESKWARAKRMRSEKLAAREGARNV